ncbi:MAG: hypothetical protein MMC33_003231 [Icmadophila ericetorum]|nr:hypothetical protein [Icmadophila ericetorum]
MTSVPQVIRVICYLSKRAELSDEEFYNYWENKHAPLVAPWLVKHGVVGYEQVHTTPYQRNIYENLLVPPLEAPPFPTMPYSGWAIMDFKSVETMRNAFLDPYYASTIGPDEDRFLDKSAGKLGVTMGIAKKMVIDGKVLVGNFGTEGEGKEGGELAEGGSDNYLSNAA